MCRVDSRAVTLLLAAVIPACGGSSSTTAPSASPGTMGPAFPQGTLVLKASPIDPAAIRWITPLGNLNPPDHTLPTDHIYFYFANPNTGESPAVRRTTFYAPGDGTVTDVIKGGGVGQESKFFVKQTSTFSYYIDHVILSSAVARGTTVTAGQVLGTTGTSYSVDLGVVNDGLTVGFLSPSRYTNSDSLHADAPLKYYTEPARGQLYALVQRLGADLDGTINHDVAGTLSGNWFSTFGSLPLSFAYDTYDPSRVLISIGVGTYPGVYGIAPGDPRPRDVTPSRGRFLYTLTPTQTGPTPGAAAARYMLIEMTDATHIREEIFLTVPADFTASALTFAR